VADKFKGKEAYYNDYFGINSQDLEAIALLHDVIEDTPADALTLIKQKIPCSLVDVIVTLTRLKHQDYLSYLLKVKDNLMAKFVKIEDIKHNLSTLDSKNKTMRDKYLLALYILEH
jgi:(p)ppGpp synthase/HD superfamily hydrolase